MLILKYSIFSRDDSFSRSLKESLKHKIESLDPSWVYEDSLPEFVICVGGDGTLLRAIHKYLERLDEILFVAVHTGTLGFFTDYTANEADDFIYDLLHKDYQIQSSRLLQICSDLDDNIYYALNEFRLGNFIRTIYLNVYIDGEIFEHTAGSGLCICTQAGSTAANRSLGGAVIDDGLEVLELTEIMPVSHIRHHSLKNPYIMKPDRIITITGTSLKDCEGSYDHLELDVKKMNCITVTSSLREVRFARLKPYSYLKRLRNLY